MTSESDFHRMLEAQPDDHATRLIFADWLQERGDKRADGYRALGANGRGAWFFAGTGNWGFISWQFSNRGSEATRCEMPRDWLKLICRISRQRMHKYNTRGRFEAPCATFLSREQAENYAALAFAKLPPERQAELLEAATAHTEVGAT